MIWYVQPRACQKLTFRGKKHELQEDAGCGLIKATLCKLWGFSDLCSGHMQLHVRCEITFGNAGCALGPAPPYERMNLTFVSAVKSVFVLLWHKAMDTWKA